MKVGDKIIMFKNPKHGSYHRKNGKPYNIGDVVTITDKHKTVWSKISSEYMYTFDNEIGSFIDVEKNFKLYTYREEKLKRILNG